jgi:hypothetical protein
VHGQDVCASRPITVNGTISGAPASFTFSPDPNNIMSYFGYCGTPANQHFSAQQNARMQQTLNHGARRHLIEVPCPPDFHDLPAEHRDGRQRGDPEHVLVQHVSRVRPEDEREGDEASHHDVPREASPLPRELVAEDEGGTHHVAVHVIHHGHASPELWLQQILPPLRWRLHEVGTIFGGPTFWPVEQSTEVMSVYREFLPSAPRELNGFYAFHTVPPGPPFQPSWNGSKTGQATRSLHRPTHASATGIRAEH